MNHEMHETHEKKIFKEEAYAVQGAMEDISCRSWFRVFRVFRVFLPRFSSARPRKALCLLGPIWFALSGCLIVDPTPEIQELPTPCELLKKTSNAEFLRGSLWERSQFFLQFPFYLLSFGSSEAQIESADLDFSSAREQEPYRAEERTVMDMLGSDRPDQRALGLEIMQGQERVRNSRLLDGLSDPDPYVRMVALQILSRDAATPLKAFETALADEDRFMRLEAVRALGRAGTDSARILLRTALRDPSPLVRGEAARILGERRDCDSLAALRILENDSEEYVRERARQAVEAIESVPQ